MLIANCLLVLLLCSSAAALLSAQPPQPGATKPESNLPGLSGPLPKDNAESKDKTKEESEMPEERKWRPAAKLDFVLPATLEACVDAMMAKVDKSDIKKTTDCKKGMTSPIEAARMLIAEAKRGQDRPNLTKEWIIQVLLLQGEDPKDQKITNRFLGSRMYLYHEGVRLDEFSGKRLFGSRQAQTLFIVRAHVGRLKAEFLGNPRTCASLKDAKSSDQKLLFTAETLKARQADSGNDKSLDDGFACYVEAKLDIGNWSANHFTILATKENTDSDKTLKLEDRKFAVPAEVGVLAQFAATKKKDPIWWNHIVDLLKIAGYGESKKPDKGRLEAVPKMLYGVGDLPKIPVPGTIWIQAGTSNLSNEDWQLIGDDANTNFTPFGPETEIDNESKYFFDASVGVPLKKIDELQYSTTNNGIQSKQVAAESILALANFLPWKADISDPTTNRVPRLLVGLGMQGRVLDRTFFGVGIGLGWGPLAKVGFLKEFQPYAGVQRTVTQVENSAIGQVKPSASWKLAVGINIPVKTAAERIAAAKKDKSK